MGESIISFVDSLRSNGVEISLINNQYSFMQVRSVFRVDTSENRVYWRGDPASCSLKLDFMENATKRSEDGSILAISFACPTSSREEDDSIVIYAKFSNEGDATEAMDLLITEKAKKRELQKRRDGVGEAKPSFMDTSMFMHDELITSQMDTLEFRSVVRQEKMLQFNDVLSRKECVALLEKGLRNSMSARCQAAFQKWTAYVREANSVSMHSDRARWRLHAAANQETDLQAWYHSTFHKEVYRLRGAFWFRDAVMPIYKQKYDIVDQGLTPLEEAALAHVLCSPETTYGDVAGQMFVVQAIVSALQFDLFQELSAKGANVTKCPRSGRPAKKLFRFSFVEGNIYLTWKGKYGNQGVDLGEVRKVDGGAVTEVTKKLDPTRAEADSYLSLICEGRSVDLRFDSKAERDAWWSLLDVVVKKENGILSTVPSCLTAEDSMLDALLYGAAVGAHAVPKEMREAAAAKWHGTLLVD